MKAAISAMDIPSRSGGKIVDPDADVPPNEKLGPWTGRALGDHFGLTHFGAYMDILEPGSKSSMRHWHEKSDEFVMMLEGELVLVTDEDQQVLSPGMVAGFKAGDNNGHHLINRSKSPARFLVVGSRFKDDKVHYPDDDFQWLEEGGVGYAARKDGTRY